MSIVSLMVTADHVVPVEPQGGSVTVSVLSGGPVYYADNSQVSSASNQGQIALSGSQTFTSPAWIVSSSVSSVQVATNALSSLNIPSWQPFTAYPAGYCVVQAGIIYTANTAFTSAATFVADATNWTALTAAGTELTYAEITANQTGISAAADLTGLAVTFTAPARPVVVELHLHGGQQVGSAADPQVSITDASNVQQATAFWFASGASAPVANAFLPDLHIFWRASLTAGTSYTFKARAATGAGTLTVIAASNQKAYMQVRQV